MNVTATGVLPESYLNPEGRVTEAEVPVNVELPVVTVIVVEPVEVPVVVPPLPVIVLLLEEVGNVTSAVSFE